jgi:hypothetical protein
MLAGSISLQRFKPVTWQRRKVRQACGPMNLAKLSMRYLSDTFEFPDPLAIEDRPSIAVAETPDHTIEYCTYRVICEAYNGQHQTPGI